MEQSFSLKSELRDSLLIIATSGYVNSVGGAAIAQEFQTHFARGIRRVVIDLAMTRVVNSVGMSFLIEIIERLSETGGRLVFANPDPSVDRMLEIMGLYGVAGKERTVEDALLTLSGNT